MRNRALFLAASIAAFFVSVTPVGAIGPGCDHVWSQMEAWSLQEARRGLDRARLDALNELIPSLVECAELAEAEGSGPERWRDLALVYFGVDEVERVLCLMALESGGDPGARNPSSRAAGLMQVMPEWAQVFGYEYEDLFDPSVNLWMAARIQEDYGWESWTPYQRGACR